MGFLLLAVLASLAAPLLAAPPGRGPTISVSADRPVEAVFVRTSPPGSAQPGPWQRVASSVPVTLSVDGSMEYDVRVEGRADLFHDWRGTQTRIQAGCALQVPTQREVAWVRVSAAGVTGFAVLAMALGLRVRRAQRGASDLRDALRQAQAQADLGPDQVPRRIGRYSVLSRVGVGGMACVYRVEDEFGDTYALKVPGPRLLEDADLRERFFREMEIGRLLHHPAIVRIYDVHPGDATSTAYIAQEFVDGGSLKDALEREACFPIARATAIARALAEALAHAHDHGVVHRDIKPANVMLTRAGDVRITDFGIARLTTVETMTGTDTTLGTPQYMAPEQVRSRTATASSDLYSLGVVLFEMLSGHLPIEEEEPFLLLARKMREKPRRVGAFRPEVGPRLDRLVNLLLQRRPEKRPATAQEVARMLAALERAEGQGEEGMEKAPGEA